MRTPEALRAADEFARENHDSPGPLDQLANLSASYSQHERAVAVFARINELRPHSPPVLYNLGVALYNCQRLDEAAVALAESADLDGRPAETHYSLALIARDRVDHENAVVELQHAIDRAPRSVTYYALLGQEFSRNGYWAGAADAYRHAAAIAPREPSYLVHLGDALLRKEDVQGAVGAFQEAARLDPKLPEINFLIGFAYQSTGEYAKSREYYERQLKSTPDLLEALANLGLVEVELGRLRRAEELLQRVLARDPDHIQSSFELGLIGFKNRDYSQAIQGFKHVLFLRPDQTQAAYYLYQALSRTQQVESAASALTLWKKLEALDRKVRTQEVAYEAARESRWTTAAP
jgi:tetratricopeptide (TPR) repeat protein